MIFLSKWAQRLHEFRKMVVDSVFGMSHEIGVKSGGLVHSYLFTGENCEILDYYDL